MATEDKMTFLILEDGTVRTTIAGISGVNHASADALVKGVEGLLAGRTEVAKLGHAHEHEHAHEKKEA